MKKIKSLLLMILCLFSFVGLAACDWKEIKKDEDVEKDESVKDDKSDDSKNEDAPKEDESDDSKNEDAPKEDESDEKEEEKIIYKFSEIEGGYEVYPGKDFNEETAIIPSSYNGKPVIEACSFRENNIIKKLIISEGIEEVSSMDKNLMLTYLELPKSLKIINNLAFSDSTKLRHVFYDGTLEDWLNVDIRGFGTNPMDESANFYLLDETGDVTFNGHTYKKLTIIDIPNNVTEIKRYQFQGIKDVTLINIPSSVKKIDNYAFYEVDAPVINLNEGLEEIGDSAFYKNNLLYNINLPTSLKKIGKYNFTGAVKFTTLTIPDGLEIIPQGFFVNAFNLKSIVLSKSVKEIGDSAFGMSALRKIYYMGNSLEKEYISIPNGVSDIVPYARWYYFTENKEAETEKGNWWYYNSDGEIVELVIS